MKRRQRHGFMIRGPYRRARAARYRVSRGLYVCGWTSTIRGALVLVSRMRYLPVHVWGAR